VGLLLSYLLAQNAVAQKNPVTRRAKA